MSGFGHITLARCWACQFGDCFEKPTPHTWMDPEDATAAGLTWPLTAEEQANRQCSCVCSGQAGHHIPLTADAAKAITDAATDLRR
jgi:hypothetical protein